MLRKKEGLLVVLVLFVFCLFNLFWFCENRLNATYSQKLEQNNVDPATWQTFWYGPIDESVLICWYYNFIHPDVHQVFYIENCPDFDEYAERYPFMKQLDVVWMNWETFFSSMDFVYDPELPQSISKRKPNHKSDVFRYMMLMKHNGVRYMDADQCLFHLDKIADVDFVVGDNWEDTISCGTFKITDNHRASRMVEILLKDFQADGKMKNFDSNEWGVIGPRYFTHILDQSNVIQELRETNTNKIPFVKFTNAEVYGWYWEDNLSPFCTIWNAAKERTGIHLYRDRRKQHEIKILELLHNAITNPNNNIIFCK